MQKEFDRKRMIVVGVSLDSVQPKEVGAFAEKMGINYPILMGDEKMEQDYGADIGLPLTYFIDGAGKIVAINPALLNQEAAKTEINHLLQAKP